MKVPPVIEVGLARMKSSAASISLFAREGWDAIAISASGFPVEKKNGLGRTDPRHTARTRVDLKGRSQSECTQQQRQDSRSGAESRGGHPSLSQPSVGFLGMAHQVEALLL
jgi:hypothetical protein